MEWKGVSVKMQAPHRAPAIFNGEPAVLYARFEGKGPGTVTLSGTADGKPVSWSVSVDPAQAGPGDLLATLAARAAIRDLEEGTSALHESGHGSAQRDRREERIRKEIVALARAYRLASSHTSFVAVEHREGAEERPAAELRQVPVSLTYGWGGIETRAAQKAVASQDHGMLLLEKRARAEAPLAQSSLLPSAPELKATAPGNGGPMYQIKRAGSVRRGLSDSPFGPAGFGEFPGGPGQHFNLIRLQQADGSWKLDAELACVLGVKLEKLCKIAESAGKGSHWHDIVATIAALRYLQKLAADFKSEWRLLAAKAEEWLAGALAGRPAGERTSVEERVAPLLRDRPW